MLDYYPVEMNISKIARLYPELEITDEDEEQRFQDVEDRKKRGKGAPKKARTKGTFNSFYSLDLKQIYFSIEQGRRAQRRR